MAFFNDFPRGFERVSGKVEEKLPPWTNSLVLFVLFLASLAVYYSSLNGDFLNIDDLHYIPENEYIHDLSLRGIYRMFSSVIVVNYFPLQILSYAIDFTLWGLNPFGYRLTNLLLHAGNGFLVYLFFRHLLQGGFWPSLIGSLIFILHPVNVESVAWISERKNLLSTFFLLLSFLSYIRYLEGTTKRTYYAASLTFFCLSLLSKVSGVVLPLLFILYDICWTSRAKKEWLKDKIPFLVISAFFSWLAVYIYQIQKIIPEFHGGHPIYTFLTMANVVVEYILSLLVPVYLYFYYDTPIVKSVWEYPLLLSLSLLAILWALSFRWYRENRPLLFCWLWFFIPLLPVLNIIPLSILRADRYLYLPSIAYSFLLVWGIPKIFRGLGRELRWLQVGAFFLILGFLGFVAEKQTRIWQNTFNLWSYSQKHSSGSAQVYMGLGSVALNRGQMRLAAHFFEEAVRRAPHIAEVLNNLGCIYSDMGRLEEARDLFQRALRINPQYIEPYVNMGIIYSKMGENSLAIGSLEKALKEGKSRATACNNLGVIYRRQGDLQRAIAFFREAIKANPALIQAQNNLALALNENGQVKEAIAHLEQTLDLQPRSFLTRYNLGRLYLQKGEPQRAAGYLNEALRAQPEDPQIHFYLAQAYRLLPQGEGRARFHFQKALQKEKDPKARAEKEKKWRDLERGLEAEKSVRPDNPKGGRS